MKQLLTILPLLLLFSCDYKPVTIEPKTIKTISFPEGSTSNRNKWKVINASDGHDYMENNGGNDYIIMHYVECNKCKKDSL